MAGGLANDWADFGGLAGQLRQLEIVIEMSITNHDGVAITYDIRIHREISKISPKRSPNADYLGFLSNINSDIRTGVIRDFESHADSAMNARERERTLKEKEKKKAGCEGEKPATEKKTWGKKWAKADWMAWRAKADSDGEGEKPDTKEAPSPKK